MTNALLAPPLVVPDLSQVLCRIIKLNFFSVSNNVADRSCSHYLLFYQAPCRSLPAALKDLARPLAVPFHHILWPLPCLVRGSWRLRSSILHQLSPAVLRNSTAYQHSSNATFYRCIGHGRTRVLQLRKYNRLAVHVSASRCGGSRNEWRVHKQELCCLDRYRVVCQMSVTNVNRYICFSQ